MLAPVGFGSVFAYLQSAAMGGYGTVLVNGIAQGCSAAASGLAWFWGSRDGGNADGQGMVTVPQPNL